MAFDGITIANLAYEFKSTLEGGKIAKIAQPIFPSKQPGR